MKTLIKISIIVASVLLFMLVTCIGILFVPDYVAETRTLASFQLYPNAEKLVESQSPYGGGSATKRIYYWSKASIEDVKAYYETFMPPFISGVLVPGVSDAQWFVTAYYVDGTQPEGESLPAYLNHERYCLHTQRYNCITLSLVELDQHQSMEIPRAISGQGQPFVRDELIEKLNMLPAGGVLMMYTYYVHVF